MDTKDGKFTSIDKQGAAAVSTAPEQEKRGPGRPPRTREDTASSREKLLEVATGMFGDWGYEPVSTAAIARAAGLSQSMVHYHFGTKEQLWREAINRLMRRRGKYFSPCDLELEQMAPLERLCVLIRRLVAANAAEPHYLRIITHEALFSTERFTWLMEEYVRPGLTAFDDAIRAAVAQGVIRPLPEHEISWIITSAASMSFSIGGVSGAMYGFDPCDPERLRSFSDTIISVLFAGLLRTDAQLSGPQLAARSGA